MTERHKGHGRLEIRTLIACDAHGVDWPGSQQVCRIDRVVCHIKTDRMTLESVYAVTSLSSHEAPAKALLELNRGHWSIENTLHYVRDVTLHEDASQVRSGNAPQVMATLRNTVISLLHQNGIRTIAATLRHLATNISEALAMVGITPLSH